MQMQEYAYLSRYRDIPQNWSARKAARRVALDALSWLPAGTERPRVHFLYLHHVLPDEVENFRALLGRLAKLHTFISYSEAVQRVQHGSIDKPYLAFSIDDGLKNCLGIADLLEEHGASACFFVCPSMADNPSYWEAKQFSETQLSLPAAEFLNWRDMEALINRGHEIGNHTAGHFTLRTLPPTRLEEEIAGAHETIAKQLGVIKHFAWPRGRFHHMTPQAVATVFRAGHSSCASAERGAHVIAAPEPEAFCIRREHIVAAWPLRHSLYFVGRSAARAGAEDNRYRWSD